MEPRAGAGLYDASAEPLLLTAQMPETESVTAIPLVAQGLWCPANPNHDQIARSNKELSGIPGLKLMGVTNERSPLGCQRIAGPN